MAEKRHHTTRFHRGHLHSALLEHVSRNTIHLNKKVVHAEADDNGVSLCFEDGTSIKGDILIGADGIRSVRLPLLDVHSTLLVVLGNDLE